MSNITIKDVARKAHVSISTVSLALNDSKKVTAETKQKVIDAANSLGYIKSINATNLRSKTKKIIYILIYKDHSNMEGAIFFSCVNDLSSKGYNVIVDTFSSKDFNQKILSMQAQSCTGSIVIYPPNKTFVLPKTQFPIMVFSNFPKYVKGDFITLDYNYLVKSTLDYLYNLECENICIITDDENDFLQKRIIEDFLNVNRNDKIIGEGCVVQISSHNLKKQIKSTLKVHPQITGFICFNSFIKYSIDQTLQLLGYSNDRSFLMNSKISIAIDINKGCEVELSDKHSIRFNIQDISDAIITSLLFKINDKNQNKYQHYLQPIKILR